MMRQSIDYFPTAADQPYRSGFFSDPSKVVQDLSFDQGGETHGAKALNPSGNRLREGGVLPEPELKLCRKREAARFEPEKNKCLKRSF